MYFWLITFLFSKITLIKVSLLINSNFSLKINKLLLLKYYFYEI